MAITELLCCSCGLWHRAGVLCPTGGEIVTIAAPITTDAVCDGTC